MTTLPMPDVRSAAIGVVCAAIRGDTAAIIDALYSIDDDGFGPLIRASLTLFRALAARLRTPEGLLAVDVRLCDISHEYGRDVPTAARLIIGHAQTCFLPDDDAETFAELHDIGADTFNQAIDDAGHRFEQVFTTTMLLLRQLLPEADTYMVGATAGQLWGSGAEPALPKLEGEGTTVKFKSRDETGPPQPRLAIPHDAQVADRRPQPPGIIPRGAVVSLRGLAARRMQERGIDSVYG